MKQHNNAIARAVEMAGGQSALARLIGRKQPTVRSWLVGRTRISPQYCAAIERATGGRVTRQQLRPDIWSRE